MLSNSFFSINYRNVSILYTSTCNKSCSRRNFLARLPWRHRRCWLDNRVVEYDCWWYWRSI